MRILHVNDIANVGATLVDGLTQIGQDAELRRLIEQFSEESQYFHSPTDANAGRA